MPTAKNQYMSRQTLPNDFFDWLSPKKEALIQVLLEAEKEWVMGDDLRQGMRDRYGLSVPDESGAIASHQGHLTKRYSKEFSRNIIDVRWADESRGLAEYQVGNKYRDELAEYFDK